jgi:hypothetical protein
MLPLSSSRAGARGLTLLSLKMALCMIMLVRLPKTAFAPTFVASMCASRCEVGRGRGAVLPAAAF